MKQSNKQLNINKVIQSKLGFEACFILYCVYTKDEDLIYNYIENCNKINTEIFLKLKDKGLLDINSVDYNSISFDILSLTKAGKKLALELTEINVSEGNFEEFVKCYPSKVQANGKARPLKVNLDRCKKLYNELLLETTHEILCKTAEIYINERKKSGEEQFTVQLQVWLNQKYYQNYIEELNNYSDNQNTKEIRNLDAI